MPHAKVFRRLHKTIVLLIVLALGVSAWPASAWAAVAKIGPSVVDSAALARNLHAHFLGLGIDSGSPARISPAKLVDSLVSAINAPNARTDQRADLAYFLEVLKNPQNGLPELSRRMENATTAEHPDIGAMVVKNANHLVGNGKARRKNIKRRAETALRVLSLQDSSRAPLVYDGDARGSNGYAPVPASVNAPGLELSASGELAPHGARTSRGIPAHLLKLEKAGSQTKEPAEFKQSSLGVRVSFQTFSQALQAAHDYASEIMAHPETDLGARCFFAALVWTSIVGQHAVMRLMTLVHYPALKRLFSATIPTLSLDGDTNKTFTVNFLPWLAVNAGMGLDGETLHIMLGLLPAMRSKDLLAAVLAHEMTHANRNHQKARRDDPAVKRALDSISAYRDLDAEHREELRADLGAVDRLIAGGYNPWAYYDLIKEVATGVPWFFRFLPKGDPRGISFTGTHPIGEVRMAAVKSYILHRGYKEDLVQNIKSYEPFAAAINGLRLWLKLCALPFRALFSWAPKAALVSIPLYLLIRSIGDFFLSAPIQDVLLSICALPLALAEGLFYGIAFNLSLWGVWTVASHTVALPRNWIRDKLQPGRFPLPGHIRMAREELDHWRSADYPWGQNRVDLQFQRLELISRLIQAAYDDSARRFYRSINGLTRARNEAVELYRRLLDGITLSMQGMSPEDRAAAYGRLMLDYSTPILFLEDAESRGRWSRIVALAGRENLSPEPEPEWQIQQNEFSTEHLLRLYRIAESLSANASPALVLRTVNQMQGNRLTEPAARLFKKHYASILDFLFSKENKEPQLIDGWKRVQSSLRGASSSATPGRRALIGAGTEVHWDYELLKANRQALKKEPLEWIGIASLLWSEKSEMSSSLPLFFLQRKQKKIFRRYLETHCRSIRDLRALVESELIPRHVLLETLRNDLHDIILSHPEWARSPEDLDALVSGEYFWPYFNSKKASPLEKYLVDAMTNLPYNFRDVWKYEPATSESLHAFYLRHLERLGRLPADMAGRIELWKTLTGRGVTARTDAMFQDLYSAAQGGQKKDLEDAALEQGRIWDQVLKASIAEHRLRESAEYRELLTLAPEDDSLQERRMELLETALRRLKRQMPERGLFYVGLLETLSADIQSTRPESARIHEEQAIRSGQKSEDLALRALSQITEEALKWRKCDQWEFIRYLRGDIPPPAKTLKSFPVVGPERIKRLYEVLPAEARATFLDAFLDSPRGLIPQVSTSHGYTKVIVDYLLPSHGEPQAVQAAHEILDAFLYALERSGNPALRSLILSYMLSLPRDPNGTAIGTLKHILEIFGPTGIKIGQFLADAQIFSEDDSEVLRDLQEKAKRPAREAMYADVEGILGTTDIPFLIQRLLGSASMKYAFLGLDRESRQPLVGKVFRQEAFAHTPAEFIQLYFMAERLYRRHGAKYGLFRSLVKASRKAVERELSAENEVAMSGKAADAVYADGAQGPIKLRVPYEVLVHKRLIVSEYAEGVSLNELPPELKALAARAILAREGDNLFSDAEVISFDPDRHAGNYRVQVQAASHGIEMTVWPIDFGQLLDVTRSRRGNIEDLFALSQILKETGSTRWAADRAALILGIPPALSSPLRKALSRYFPARDMEPVAAYYSLLAALDDVGQEPDIVHFDYVRAVWRLKRYESLAGEMNAPKPLERFETIIRNKSDRLLSEMRLTRGEKLRIALSRRIESWTQRRFIEEPRRRVAAFFSRAIVKAALLLAVLGFAGQMAYHQPLVRQATDFATTLAAKKLLPDYEGTLRETANVYVLVDKLCVSTNSRERAAAEKLLRERASRGGAFYEEVIYELRSYALAGYEPSIASRAGRLLVDLVDVRSGLDHGFLLKLISDAPDADVRRKAAVELQKDVSDDGWMAIDRFWEAVKRASFNDLDDDNREFFRRMLLSRKRKNMRI